MSLFDLTGKTIVIVGGAGKLGQRWANVLRLQHTAVFTLDKIRHDGVDYVCDVNYEKEIKQKMKDAGKQYGIDILIYAVMAKPKDYYADCDDYPMETFRKVIDANLNGAYLCSREAKRYGVSNIIFISSVQGLVGADPKLYDKCTTEGNIYGGKHGLKCPVSYTASKWGLIGLAKHLACWWAPEVRVNVLAPSGVYDGQEKGFVDEFKKRCPMQRMADISDLDGAIVFLASDASRYMTGSVLTVDGGWTAW